MLKRLKSKPRRPAYQLGLEIVLILLVKVILMSWMHHHWFSAPTVPTDGEQRLQELWFSSLENPSPLESRHVI
ncbi:hypothetical protein SAMN05421831_109101 [Allopseudospirillum japonicum]|uniref:Uncharacterized protein n=1 Tax=Allopseudospirillum japonicum TaxID=64971 RepID=A0A1H6TJS1_9GAMM|nr:hypothetical protein [Allopseudospirillum japonicum]SEI76002.1 hypothetical protein SAMN05421831_109101 [Allopseudospirillum japonicum]